MKLNNLPSEFQEALPILKKFVKQAMRHTSLAVAFEMSY